MPPKSKKVVEEKVVENEKESINSKQFPPTEEMLAGLNEIEELIEKVKETQSMTNITVDNYYLPFGKYKFLLGKSVLNIIGTDKNGKTIPIGRRYLSWMLNLDYLHQKDKLIISKLLDM